MWCLMLISFGELFAIINFTCCGKGVMAGLRNSFKCSHSMIEPSFLNRNLAADLNSLFLIVNSLCFKSEMTKLQSKLDDEVAKAEETVRAQLKVEFQQRECEIAERLRKERDRQLEATVQRLEEEASLSRDETEKSAQDRIK